MQKLPDIKTHFAEWYQEIITQADLIDQSPTKGCFIIKPYGYALWEQIQTVLDQKIKSEGVQNTYFPLLIPEEFLKREEKHVEGFSPEVAVVTHAGGKELEAPYVIRPTSETIIYDTFARWIKSWRDLPLKINQWANVVRWEMRTRAFLRTTEFLWQEGHTAHETYQEAKTMALTMLNHYKTLAEEYLAIPVIVGEKSPNERFPGADATYTFEGLMQDGRALQMGTSHLLSQSFPASFGVKFQNKEGVMQTPYCTSWGATTRLIGAIIMTHGDQDGLIMPPRIAPVQIVIVPIYKTDEERAAVLAIAHRCVDQLKKAQYRVVLDDDNHRTPGAKFYHWEIRGVPVRIEIGPKDIANQELVLVNRAISDKTEKKKKIKIDHLLDAMHVLLHDIHQLLFEKALQRRNNFWVHSDKLSTFGPRLEESNGLYQAGWCGKESCELRLKEFKGTIRCVISDRSHATCFACEQPSQQDVLVAKCY